jgi:CPA2 family monovalent cation:H+ antiporter-2
MARGESSIIVANLAKAGNLLPALQPFAALYVLILSVLGPILTKYSEVIYKFFVDPSPRQPSLARQGEPEGSESLIHTDHEPDGPAAD